MSSSPRSRIFWYAYRQSALSMSWIEVMPRLSSSRRPCGEHVVDMARDVRLHETVAYRDGCTAQNTGQFTVLVTNVRSAVWVRHVAVQAEFFESLGIEPQGVPVHGPYATGMSGL